jgi:hypothetical protein
MVRAFAVVIVAAALAQAQRMLVASMAGKPGTDVISRPLTELDLARADRAQVTKEPDGFVVRWSQHPPAGYEIDAEVRVRKDGVTEVARASASFSPD